MKSMILLSLFIGLQLILQSSITKAHNNKYILVKGFAKVISGNKMPVKRKSSEPLQDKLSIAVLGHVKTVGGKPNIPVKSISSKIIETKTDQKGMFEFSLSPGFYTFFLVNKDQAYLNRFDGNGFFRAMKVITPQEDLQLIDDRNVLY